MLDNDEMVNRNGGPARSNANASGWLGKVLTFAAGAVLLVVGFVFSLLVFALAATAALAILGLFWWQTRAPRRQMRERPSGGRVIDGEAIRQTRRP
jgi:4-hydroxybenzoate polyprenyltransferase